MDSGQPVAIDPIQRGTHDTTRRRLGWLLLLSLVLHLVFTPAAGWLGLFSLLLERPEIEPPELEQLNAIPVELFEDTREEPAANELPEEDPVGLIDELLPDAPSAEPAAKKPEAEEKPEEEKADEKPTLDAGAESSEESSSEQQPSSEEPEQPQARVGDAGADAKRRAEADEQGRAIGNPVAISGQAGDLVKSNARLGLTIYTDRIRKHPVGRRIGEVLPNLPQWKDFFGGSKLNPIEDFDRLFMAGPSFYYTDEMVVALQYNTEQRAIRGAIDRLVQRQGAWLKNTPVPAAVARADRALRLFIMPAPKLVMVVPPRLRQQALRTKFKGIPPPQGPEALVAVMKEPKGALARVGIQVSDSVKDARLRITPLDDGAVRIEISAREKDAAAAKRTASQVTRGVNGFVELVSGASNLLSQFGLGGFKGGVRLPRIELEARGKRIYGEQILSEEHAHFILDRVERQLLRRRSRAPRAAPKPGQGKPPAKKPAETKAPRPKSKPRTQSSAEVNRSPDEKP